MPKASRPLYIYSTRNAIACHVNISTNPSGCSFYSYVSSQIRLDPLAPKVRCKDETFVMDINIDVNEDYVVRDYNEDVEQLVEVILGVHVVSRPNTKWYENSVSSP